MADEADKLRQVATREKALADEADKLRQAAAREKALADEADKLHQAAAREKAVADEANKQRWTNTRKKALADKAYKRGRAATWKKVLARSTRDVADGQLRLTANPRWHVAAANLVFVLVATMSPKPPIHRSTFFAGGDIGPVLPTNLL